jgi:uncharacterized protein (DUF2384 family)
MGERDRSTKAAGAGQTGFDESHCQGQPYAAATGDSKDEIALVRRATEVLGIDHVAHWMRSEIPSLGNRTPYALMKTEDGRTQVERVLLKIEHGVY